MNGMQFMNQMHMSHSSYWDYELSKHLQERKEYRQEQQGIHFMDIASNSSSVRIPIQYVELKKEVQGKKTSLFINFLLITKTGIQKIMAKITNFLGFIKSKTYRAETSIGDIRLHFS